MAPELQKALECLEDLAILRRRPSEAQGGCIWLLQHDFLCRGVLAAERFANRWRSILQEQAGQFKEAAGIMHRWRALLTPWQQVQLGVARLAGKFRYAGERRFAMLSTLRFLPFLLLLIAVLAASAGYRVYQDALRAERYFAAIKAWGSEKASGDALVSALAASPARVRWKVLRLAFGS